MDKAQEPQADSLIPQIPLLNYRRAQTELAEAKAAEAVAIKVRREAEEKVDQLKNELEAALEEAINPTKMVTVPADRALPPDGTASTWPAFRVHDLPTPLDIRTWARRSATEG